MKLTQKEMFERSFQRPRNYFDLSPEEQWKIDSALGIQDWDGGDLSADEFARFNAHYAPTRKTYYERMRELFESCAALSEKKSADYADEDDPFSNFRSVEALGLCKVETGILVRLTDKFCRLTNLLGNQREPVVTDESIEDTIKDAINYLAILYLYLHPGSKADDSL